ncbi:MAG TPA: pyridoxal-phosphate dependent enzyme [Ohtaekwangia sp.]
MLSYNPGPVIEIFDPVADEAGVRVLIKREDQNHRFVSGNKWWKLKNNLVEAKRLGKNTILTFGGAYSNHIFSTAAAANELQFQSIGIIRGEEITPLNATLQFAKEKGMQLHFVTRESYRRKTETDFIQSLEDLFGDFYLIPEGGSNELAVKGCEEFGNQLSTLEFDYLCLPVGTGGTLAGIIRGIPERKVIGFSALKGGVFLKDDVLRFTPQSVTDWQINTDYHFGGYAKTTDSLIKFITSFESKHNVLLDQVYTGKMMFGVFDLIKKGFFSQGTTILILHTGGLQGKSF